MPLCTLEGKDLRTAVIKTSEPFPALARTGMGILCWLQLSNEATYGIHAVASAWWATEADEEENQSRLSAAILRVAWALRCPG